eukprot:2593487-Pyramimonas_sp.AAC.1
MECNASQIEVKQAEECKAVEWELGRSCAALHNNGTHDNAIMTTHATPERRRVQGHNGRRKIPWNPFPGLQLPPSLLHRRREGRSKEEAGGKEGGAGRREEEDVVVVDV